MAKPVGHIAGTTKGKPMPWLNVSIALLGAAAAAYLAVRRSKTVASQLSLGALVFLSVFAGLWWMLPAHGSPRQMLVENTKQAALGDAKAQYELGMAYNLGEAVAKDKAQAVYWIRRSAEQGYGEAQIALGTMYINGHYQNEGVPKDYRQGKAWIGKAAKQGSIWARMLLYNMDYDEKSHSK